MYIQLPDYDDFRRFGLPNGADLAAISNGFYEGYAKPSWLTITQKLLSANMPKKLFRAMR